MARPTALVCFCCRCDFTEGPQTYWLDGGEEYHGYHDQTKVKGPDVFRGLVAAMRDAVGPDFVLMACTGPDLVGVGLYDAARACEDSEEGRSHSFDPQAATYMEGSGNGIGVTPGVSRRRVLTNACAKAPWHGELYCIASGGHCLTLDHPIGAAEARLNATMAVMSGGITMLGDDPRAWSSVERQELAKRCLPPLAGPPAILDLFSSGVGDEFGPGLFARVVRTPWDDWWLVGHCNASNSTADRAVNPSDLPPLPPPPPPPPPTPAGFVGGGAASATPALLYCFDVHNQHFLGELDPGAAIATTTKALDASLLRVWRARPYPFVGGCDRHVSEGGFAVRGAAWEAEANGQAGALTITLRGLTTEATTVRVTLPMPWKPSTGSLKQQLRVLRVTKALCWCTLRVAPAAAPGDRVVVLGFEQAE